MSEVIGGVLMLSLAFVGYAMLAVAMLDQARETASYIRSLVPDGNETAPANATAPQAAQACLSVPSGTWCQVAPGQPGVGVCVRDSDGVAWCLQAPKL
ncbi:MAG: hypothetical protein LC624_00465 [Halobacteriales archaeon]|nr:hypothetical protein [Halobacteriales archaeon]